MTFAELFFVYISPIIAITYVVTRSELFRPLREKIGARRKKLGYLAQCAVCFSMWAGFIVGSPLLGLLPGWLRSIALCGCAGLSTFYILEHFKKQKESSS